MPEVRQIFTPKHGGEKCCCSQKPKGFLTALISYSTRFWLWRGHSCLPLLWIHILLSQTQFLRASAPFLSPCPLQTDLLAPSRSDPQSCITLRPQLGLSILLTCPAPKTRVHH